MSLFREVIRLKPASPELEEVRAKALGGDQAALKTYAYYGALQKIRGDRFIPEKQKLPIFKAVCKADLVEVELVHG